MAGKRIHQQDDGGAIQEVNDLIPIDRSLGGGSFKTYFLRADQFGAITTITDGLHGYIESPVDSQQTLVLLAETDGTIERLAAQVSAGTLTFSMLINGVAVTGSSIAVTTSVGTATPTGANAYVAGDKIEIKIASTVSAADLAFSIIRTVNIN